MEKRIEKSAKKIKREDLVIRCQKVNAYNKLHGINAEYTVDLIMNDNSIGINHLAVVRTIDGVSEYVDIETIY